MKIADIRLALRPRSIFEILDLAVVVLRRSAVDLWPVYAVMGVLWAAALLAVQRIPEDGDRGTVLILLLLAALLLRFLLQIIVVLYCGRWVFSEKVKAGLLLLDLKSVGVWRMLGRGLLRFVKWASGFALLVPLWIVLVYRFFDYEHWLLERIGGSALRQRLRGFRSGRVFSFRLLHFCIQALYVTLVCSGLEAVYQSLTGFSPENVYSPELVLTLLLAYEPFFLISRFLLYLQIRIDTEAWDVGVLFREGIRRTLSSRLLLMFLVSVVPLSTTLQAEDVKPYITAPADRPCTDSMKELPFITCEPAAYRIYSADEIEQSMPEDDPGYAPEPVEIQGLETIVYAIVVALLSLLLFFLYSSWSRHRDLREYRPKPGKALVKEFETLQREDRLSLIQKALQSQSFKTALGHSYLLLIERLENSEAGSTMVTLTPEELRLRLRDEPYSTVANDLILQYEQVFYAGGDAVNSVTAIRRLLESEGMG